MKVRNSNGELKELVIKANDSIPAGSVIEFDGDVVPEGYEKVKRICKHLGTVNNKDEVITLKNDKLSNYDFLVVSSGYGLNRSITTVPVVLLQYLGDSGKLCTQYVKTYNGFGTTSISYIDDISFKINGAVITSSNATDTTTSVYGIKL